MEKVIVLLQLVLSLLSNPQTAHNLAVQSLASQAITMASHVLYQKPAEEVPWQDIGMPKDLPVLDVEKMNPHYKPLEIVSPPPQPEIPPTPQLPPPTEDRVIKSAVCHPGDGHDVFRDAGSNLQDYPNYLCPTGWVFIYK